MARVVPPEAVHEALDAHGRNSRRIRAFPAVAGVYYVMALSLYPEASYEAVFSAVSQGLAWHAGVPQPAGVSKVAISLLRSRIGAQPLADLVRHCCVPLAEEDIHPHAFYRGWRLVGIDGSSFELADEPELEKAFGRPGGR
ncbi:MAG: transposase domain-containing protein [Rubrivivax sp.]